MSARCQGCRDGQDFQTRFSMAFQPIVDVSSGALFAYEALVRGCEGQGAFEVLSKVDDTNRYAFDQACRVTAIETATRIGIVETGALLSINFMPNAVYEPVACIRLTLAAAKASGFPTDRLLFEFTENERVDHAHVGNIITSYKALGFKTAIDDFGAGYSGLTLLANWRPDVIKLDMELVRGIDRDQARRVLVRAIVSACGELGVAVLGEGVETVDEAQTLRELGVNLHQGYIYARPGFEVLPIPALVCEPSSVLTALAA